MEPLSNDTETQEYSETGEQVGIEDNCYSVSFDTKILNKTDFEALVLDIEQECDRYAGHIDRPIYMALTQHVLSLYNYVAALPRLKLHPSFRFHSSSDFQTSLFSASVTGEHRQGVHLSVLNACGIQPGTHFAGGAVTINPEMIANYLAGIESSPEIKEVMTEFVMMLGQILPNHVPYFFSKIVGPFGLMDERLGFINHYTDHALIVSICPLTIVQKYAHDEGSEVHHVDFINMTVH